MKISPVQFLRFIKNRSVIKIKIQNFEKFKKPKKSSDKSEKSTDLSLFIQILNKNKPKSDRFSGFFQISKIEFCSKNRPFFIFIIFSKTGGG
jgi:hypothetical protein